MSNTQFAFINKLNVPDQGAWQRAIDSIEFKVRLLIDPELEPFKDEGFSPCVWGDTKDDVGFEIYYESSSDIHDENEDLKAIIGDNDYCISMRWGGSYKDCAAVMIASCALAKEFAAVISYEGEDPQSLQTLINSTHLIIAEAEKES